MAQEKTYEAAKGKWLGILTALGIDPKYLDGRPRPCPQCGGKDRFRFDNKDGSGSYYCNSCKPGKGIQLVMLFRGWDFPRAAKEVDSIIGRVQKDEAKPQRSEEEKMAIVQKLWKSAQKIAPGDPVHTYLERRCGDPGAILGPLRYHPATKHSAEFPGTFPTLLANIQGSNGKCASVHRTFLTMDGRKALVDPVRKIMPGHPISGGAIRLGPAQEVLGIAEGIETAICAGKIFGMPVWAAISAGGLLSWEPPPEAREIWIFGDADSNFVGQAAAFKKAQTLVNAGFRVQVHIPKRLGTDWADVWIRESSIDLIGVPV